MADLISLKLHCIIMTLTHTRHVVTGWGILLKKSEVGHMTELRVSLLKLRISQPFCEKMKKGYNASASISLSVVVSESPLPGLRNR